MARFLSPDDYGLVAMMAVFIAVANSLMDSGFKQALIRLKHATQADLSTAFYANLALGVLSYCLLFCAAPLIASFYEEAKLIDLIRVAGVAILLNSFQVVQSAVLSRALNFKAHLKATIPASIISGVSAVILAYIGWGVWALISQMLLAALFTTLFLWTMRLWRPSLEFSPESLSQMFGFGSKLFLSGLLDTVFRNIFVIVIAKLFAATIAGYYFFAEKIKELILHQLVSSIQTVTYPALATMQDDNSKLKAGYRRVVLVTTFLLFPAMAFVAALAEPLFIVLLPDKWLPAVPYLQLMCISGLMYPLNAINLNILKVKGRSDLFLHLEIIKKVFIVVVLLISVQYGVFGILIGQIVSSFFAYLPNSYFSVQLIDYSVKEQIGDVLPYFVLSGGIAGVTLWGISVSSLPAIVELLVFGILAGISYFLFSYALKLEAWKLVEQILRERFRRTVV